MATKLTRNDPIVFHFRLGKGVTTEPKAGATVVFLPDRKRFGIALCCPKDRYSKKWGRKIATERANCYFVHNKSDTLMSPSRPRIRNRRFNSSSPYTGPLEMESIRHSARELVCLAAGQVGNPLIAQASILSLVGSLVFPSEADKKALADVGITRGS